jgi:hypothetical protein
VETEEKLGWSLSPAGNVVLTMTVDDWHNLLLSMGCAAGAFRLARDSQVGRASRLG